MNRRTAVKSLGLLLGAAVSPGVARAISAGYRAPALGSSYRVLTAEQGELLATLAEIIIPATDTPGARAARVDYYIDGLLADVFTVVEREQFLAGLNDVDARARATHGVVFVEATPERRVALMQILADEGKAAPPRPRRRRGRSEPGAFFPWLKELTVVGYYTSEIGATQELKYVHVAGKYDGDVPYRTVGRAYS